MRKENYILTRPFQGNVLLKLLTVITVLALAALVSLSLTGCGSGAGSSAANSSTSEKKDDNAGSGELTKVRYGIMTGGPTQWINVVGNKEGIWEKHGLEIEAAEFASGIESVDALTTGSLDIAFIADFALVNRLGATAENTDIRAFEEISTSKTYQLYANPEKVKKIEDLKGKNIIATKGTFIEYLNGVTLQKAGLTDKDVTYQTIEGPTDVLALVDRGDADAYWASGTTAQKLIEAGWESVATQSDIDVTTYSFHVSTEKYLSENKETVKKFIEAVEEIYAYLEEHTDEAAETVSTETGMDQDMFKASLGGMENKQQFTKGAYDTIQEINQWAREYGFYETEYDFKDFINADVLEELYPDRVDWK